MRFTKAHRLRLRREYLALAARGRKLYTRDFVVFWTPRATGPSRIGVTVTNKVARGAGRTRVKRLVREAFRRNQHEFARPVDLSFIAKRSVTEVDYHGVERQLLGVIRQVGKG